MSNVSLKIHSVEKVSITKEVFKFDSPRDPFDAWALKVTDTYGTVTEVILFTDPNVLDNQLQETPNDL